MERLASYHPLMNPYKNLQHSYPLFPILTLKLINWQNNASI